MSKVLERELTPDFSEYSIWRNIRGRRAALDRVKQLNGEAVSMREIEAHSYPKNPKLLDYRESAGRRPMMFSDRELMEWRWRVNQGLI